MFFTFLTSSLFSENLMLGCLVKLRLHVSTDFKLGSLEHITAFIVHVTKLEFRGWSCSSDRADLIFNPLAPNIKYTHHTV